MSSFLGFLLQLYSLVAMGAVLAMGLRLLGRRAWLGLDARAELRLHYLLLALLPLALLLPESGGDFRFEPVARVMEPAVPAQTLWGSSAPGARLLVGGVSRAAPHFSVEACAFLALAALLLGIVFVAREYLRLRAFLGGCVEFRRVGRVRLAVFEGSGSPFSALTLRGAWVAVPEAMLGSEALRIAVAHELQHHRNRDTAWCHLFAPLRALCFFHPLLRPWSAVVAEAQELACDEALVSSQKKWISARNYSECLVLAAETAAKGRAGRAYAAAPALFSERRLLKRRIESMYNRKTNRKWIAYALGCALACGMGLSAGASQQWLVDSRITMREAERMAEEARKGSEFPIAVNDDVLRYLNKYLGTVKGREFLRGSLERLEALRPRFEAKLAQHGAPEELLAVGLIESGYRNLPSSENTVSGAAGIWQFIASTARVFGLRVDARVDERLDIDLETDAAFRYLMANKMRFNDWLLGVMAYNMGERALDAAIRKAGTRDPWELVKRGYENDSDYLPKFMAALLILRNPQALK